MEFRVEVDDRAYQLAIPAALEEWRLEAEEFISHAADKVVELAQGFAPKRTGRLAAAIHRGPLVRFGAGAYIEVGVEGVREAVYMEFGTYKDRPHPFMRPALGLAAGGLRSAGYGARLVYSQQARRRLRRMRARVSVQRAQRQGRVHLTPAEARLVGRQISSRLAYRRPRRSRRAP